MKPSTYFALMAEFNCAHIPVVEIGRKYFGYDDAKSKTEARLSNFPFPVFRAGGQKSVWVADISDVSEYFDKLRDKAREEYKSANRIR